MEGMAARDLVRRYDRGRKSAEEGKLEVRMKDVTWGLGRAGMKQMVDGLTKGLAKEKTGQDLATIKAKGNK